MGTTLQNLVIPSLASTPNVPSDMLAFGNAVEKQIVMSFATSTARDAAITSPVAGMVAYLSTPKQITIYDGSAWVIWYEPKQAYSLTTISQGVSSPSCTTTRGWSQRSGGLWRAHISLAITGAGTAGSGITINLPFTLQNADDVGGSFVYTDTGTANYVGGVLPSTTTAVSFIVHNAGSSLGATPSFACANTDVFRIDLQGSY